MGGGPSLHRVLAKGTRTSRPADPLVTVQADHATEPWDTSENTSSLLVELFRKIREWLYLPRREKCILGTIDASKLDHDEDSLAPSIFLSSYSKPVLSWVSLSSPQGCPFSRLAF